MVSNLLFVTLLVVKCASCLYEVKRVPPNYNHLSPCRTSLLPSHELCDKNGVRFVAKYYCNKDKLGDLKPEESELLPDQASLIISTSHDRKGLQKFYLVNPRDVPINLRESNEQRIKKASPLCDSFKAQVEPYRKNENKITIEYFNSDVWYCLLMKGDRRGYRDRHVDKCIIIKEEKNLQLDQDYSGAQFYKGLPEGYWWYCWDNYPSHPVCSVDGVLFKAFYFCSTRSSESFGYKLVASRDGVTLATYMMSNSFRITSDREPGMENACSLFRVHVSSDRKEVGIQYFNDGLWWCNCFKEMETAGYSTSCGQGSSSYQCQRYRDYVIP